MSIIARDEYSDEIKEKRFDRVIALLRDGKVSTLNQQELNLLADHLEDPKGANGRPKKNDYFISEYLHGQLESLKASGMKRKNAIDLLKDQEGMSFKDIERHITKYNKYLKELEGYIY